MNIAFILRSFGVNVDESQVREIERVVNSGEMRDALARIPPLLSTLEARLYQMETQISATHLMVQKLLGANPIESEYVRQFIMFPPTEVLEAAEAGARIVERMTENVGRTEDSCRGENAAGNGKFRFG